MHSTALAEWTLARFTGKPHAAAILGDLEETSTHKGDAWFWRSYLRILCACAWRPLAAYLVIVFTSDWQTRVTWKFTEYSVRAHGAAPIYSGWLGLFLTFLVPALLTVTTYTFVRFGPRDMVSKLAAAYLLFAFGAIFLWWMPALRIALVAVAAAFLLFSMFTSAGRRGMASLAIMAAVQPVLFVILMIIGVAANLSGVVKPGGGVPLAGPMLTLIGCIIFGRVHQMADERSAVVSG